MSASRSLPGDFQDRIRSIVDPRCASRTSYPLVQILFMALCATLAGCEGWTAIADFARLKKPWFEQWFDLPYGTPSDDTFRRVFEVVKPQALTEAFACWVEHFRQHLPAEVIAIDGKSIRGAFDKANRTTPLHLLHVWATEQKILLGQRAVAGAPGEIAATEELLECLELQGTIVTVDAHGCTQSFATKALERGADYVMAVKGNRASVHTHTKQAFEQAASKSWHTEVDKGHGRLETRRICVLDADRLPPREHARWAGLRTLIQLERTRVVADKSSTETHYYLSSLPPDAKKLVSVIRTHWSVENQLHWVLDVSMGEDACRVRDRTSAENLAHLRRLALTLLNRPEAGSQSLRRKQRMAGWSDEYLMKLLTLGTFYPTNQAT